MRRPTIDRLARAAGVSVATVKRVLSGSDQVRPRTKEKVWAVAEAIGSVVQDLKTRLCERDTVWVSSCLNVTIHGTTIQFTNGGPTESERSINCNKIL